MSKAFLLLLFLSVSAFADDPAPDRRAELCTEIKNYLQQTPASNPEALKALLSRGDPTLVGALRNMRLPRLYRSLRRAMNQENFQDSCINILPAPGSRNSRGQAQLNLIASGVASSGERQNQSFEETSVDTNQNYCETCGDNTPQDLEDQIRRNCEIPQLLISAPSQVPQGPECQCLTNLQRLRCQTFDPAIVSRNLRSAALTSVGQRFLGEFAQLREDVVYYQSQARRVTGLNDKASRCSDFAPFMARVRQTCPSAPGIEERMQTVLNSFSSLEAGTSQELFTRLNADILSAPSGRGGRITRGLSDNQRNALSLIPETRAVEKMIQDCLIGDAFFGARNAWENETIGSNENNIEPMPFQKISQLLKRKAFEKPEEFITKYLSREKLGPYYDTFVNYIRTPANRDSTQPSPFDTQINELMKYHPGFDRLLSNATFIRRVTPEAINGNLRAWLETDASQISADMINQCRDLQTKFAALVCASDENIQSQIGTADMARIIGENADMDPPLTLGNIDQLSCYSRGTFSRDTTGVFRQILKAPADSDYYNRYMYPETNSSVITYIGENVETNNQEFLARVRRGIENSGGSIARYVPKNDPLATTYLQENPDVSGSFGAESSAAGSFRAQTRTARVQDTAERTSEDSKTTNPNDPNSQQRRDQAATNMMASLPVIIPPSTVAPQANESDAKRTLRQNLATGDQQETVNRLVSNLDDDAAGELSRLRQELAQNQQSRLAELNSRADRLQRQLRDSEQERTRLQDQVDTVTRNPSAATNRAPASTALRDTIEPAPVRDNTQRIVAPQNQQTSNSQQAGSASFSGSIADSGSSAARSTTSRESGGSSGALTISRYEPARAGGPVTVEAQSGPSTSSGATQEDLNRNIRQYLEQQNIDLETLIQIKESGMLYRYRVNERGQSVQREMLVAYSNLDENLRNLIDQKILSSRATPAQIERISSDIRLRKRNYSYETLRAIIIGSSNGTL